MIDLGNALYGFPIIAAIRIGTAKSFRQMYLSQQMRLYGLRLGSFSMSDIC